jgi:hypothetical protein
MDRFENRIIKGTHASRYIASYAKMGGRFNKKAGHSEFEEWLRSLPLELTDEEIDHISEMARNGKMEFEFDVKRFMESRK